MLLNVVAVNPSAKQFLKGSYLGTFFCTTTMMVVCNKLSISVSCVVTLRFFYHEQIEVSRRHMCYFYSAAVKCTLYMYSSFFRYFLAYLPICVCLTCTITGFYTVLLLLGCRKVYAVHVSKLFVSSEV